MTIYFIKGVLMILNRTPQYVTFYREKHPRMNFFRFANIFLVLTVFSEYCFSYRTFQSHHWLLSCNGIFAWLLSIFSARKLIFSSFCHHDLFQIFFVVAKMLCRLRKYCFSYPSIAVIVSFLHQQQTINRHFVIELILESV